METFKRAIKSWINTNTTAFVRSLASNDDQLSKRKDVSSNTLVSSGISNTNDSATRIGSAGTNSRDAINQDNVASAIVASPPTAAIATTNAAQTANITTIGSTLSTASTVADALMVPGAAISASAQANTALKAMSLARATVALEPSG